MTVKKQSTSKVPGSARSVVRRAPKSGQFVGKAGFAGVPANTLAGSALSQIQGQAISVDNQTVRAIDTEIRAKTSLKTAGGSLVMTVPAAVRKALGYAQGTELSVSVYDGKMIIEAVEPAEIYA